MDPVTMIFLGIFALVAGRFLFGRIRYGSWTGSFLKARIERTVGEIKLSSGFATLKLVVHAMRADAGEDKSVALVFIAAAPLGASLQPHKLSRTQARELALYLNQAAT